MEWLSVILLAPQWNFTGKINHIVFSVSKQPSLVTMLGMSLSLNIPEGFISPKGTEVNTHMSGWERMKSDLIEHKVGTRHKIALTEVKRVAGAFPEKEVWERGKINCN